MPYDTNEVMKTLARDISRFTDRIKSSLSYDKTYAGLITGKDGHTYAVQINNETYHITSKYPFQIGASVYVTAIQNDMSRLLLRVTYDDLAQL